MSQRTENFEPKPRKITIIGGGMSCGATLAKIANNIDSLKPIEIEIIEASNTLGPGLAWDKKNVKPFHFANMYGSQEEVLGLSDSKELFPNIFDDTDEFSPHLELPRVTNGKQYLIALAQCLQELREHGVKVTKTTSTSVTDVRLNDSKDGYVVVTDKGEKPSDYVVLATGHWQHKRPENQPGVFESPWPASKIEAIDSNQPIAVMGTSLSAVDAALTLAHKAGTFNKDRNGKVTFKPKNGAEKFKLDMFSHHGMLPSVLSKIEVYDRSKTFNAKLGHGPTTLQKMYDVFKEQFLRDVVEKKIDQHPTYAFIAKMLVESPTLPDAIDNFYKHYPENAKAIEQQLKLAKNDVRFMWQEYVHSAMSSVDARFQALGAEDQKYFTEEVRPVIIKLLAGMVISNAEQMLALMKSGHLEVHPIGKEYAIGTSKERAGGDICYKDASGRNCEKHYDAIVKATGDDLHRLKNSSPLMKNLFASGMVMENYARYTDQAKGKAEYEREQAAISKDPALVPKTACFGGVYARSNGGIRMDDFRVLPASKELHESSPGNFFVLGPPVVAQIPVVQGINVLQEGAQSIVTHIEADLKKRREVEAKEAQKPKKLLAVLSPQETNFPSTIVVCHPLANTDQMENIRHYVAGETGAEVAKVVAMRADELPPPLTQLLARKGVETSI